MIILNTNAVQHADHLIETGSYAINTVWTRNQPNEVAVQAFLQANGVDELRRWFLAEDTSQPENSPAHYLYPIGDFKRLHVSGVIAARRAAALAEQETIADAAESILDLIAKLNAC